MGESPGFRTLKRESILDTTLWIVLSVVAVVIVIYLVTMRVFFKQSKDADKKIDMSKVREWKDED
ncbi:MAG: hypothetical protein JWO70_637 [Betaproteobacteria bacterium]|nr:hypothetical protein [Betaproteobacteria bacterium]